MGKKAAVILSGCGNLDGSEIHEAVLSYLAMAENGISYHSFALDKPIAEVISHLTKKVEPYPRNSLNESARIARGDISNLKDLDVNKYDILWMPGGLGAATTLSDFSTKGVNCTVEPEVVRVVKEFHRQKKPIVALCIAPGLVAKVFQGEGLQLTFGTSPDANAELEALGCKPKFCTASEVSIDEKNQIYSAPAYMEPPNIAQIYQSLTKIAKAIC